MFALMSDDDDEEELLPLKDNEKTPLLLRPLFLLPLMVIVFCRDPWQTPFWRFAIVNADIV